MQRVYSLLFVSLSLLGCGHPIRDLATKVKQAGTELGPSGDSKATPSCAAQPTTRIELSANLHVEAATPAKWDSAAPELSSSLTVSSVAYAADGQVVQLRIVFVSQGPGAFDWHVLTTAATPHELGSGTITFDERGALESVDTVLELHLSSASGVVGAPIQLFFGSSLEQGGDGLQLTSTGEPSLLRSYAQDGHAPLSSCQV